MTHAPDQAATLTALSRLRPDLVDPYLDASAPARAAVLARLWSALAREPIPGVAGPRRHGERLTVTLDDGRILTGPATAAEAFRTVKALTLTFDGEAFEHPARLVEAMRLPGAGARLVTELDNSVANLALAHAAHTPAPLRDLVDFEQSIVDGHPLHPCCRTRIGLSTEDVLRYAPEYHPVVDLHVLEVDPAHWHTSGAPKRPLLPVHPRQLDRVLASGVARDTGTTIAARPLMSLRTLAPVDEPSLHLKTAIDVQMTSAVRTLAPATVHNGPLASALLAGLAKRTPGLRILCEPSGASIVLDGEEQRSMAVVWREAPVGYAQVLPLAVLAARPQTMSDEFFDALVELMLPPLLTMLHFGVALEAHGQNTLVAVADGRPVELLYRDVGGILVSPRRLARAGVEMPPLRGSVPTDDPDALRTKLFAAAIATVLNSVISRPQQWDRIAATAEKVFDDLPEDRGAFFADTLPLKATTAMRLAQDPLEDLWARIPNPMRR